MSTIRRAFSDLTRRISNPALSMNQMLLLAVLTSFVSSQDLDPTQYSGYYSLSQPGTNTVCSGPRSDICGANTCLTKFSFSVNQTASGNQTSYDVFFSNFPTNVKGGDSQLCYCFDGTTLVKDEGSSGIDNNTTSNSFTTSASSSVAVKGSGIVNCTFSPPFNGKDKGASVYCQFKTMDGVTCSGSAAYNPFSDVTGKSWFVNGTAVSGNGGSGGSNGNITVTKGNPNGDEAMGVGMCYFLFVFGLALLF